MAGRRPTLDDVARAAGVHKATASRALNPETRNQVKFETAHRITVAARRLGYVPNTLARGLRTSRSTAVGVLVPDLTNPLFPPIVRGIQDRLDSHGYTALLVNTDNDEERERAQFAELAARRVDGFIVATARRDHPLLAEAVGRGTALVTVNRTVELPGTPAVVGDDADGVAQAVAHLRGLGHTRIAHLAGPQSVSTGAVRLRAFRQAAGRARDAVVECAAYTEQAGRAGARRLLLAHPSTTAVLAGNDLIALGALAELAAQGRSCPDDISVVGFNDMPFADRFRPPLTTVRVPHHEMGVQAAELLLELLTRPQPVARTVVLPARLVVRGSTAPPPASR
ncbi:LacI family DNA-binding transcriptional regulator [Streptacidiphilus carbonis]|uniref:LacI family DNA-binding transcriptional regulator n=1 Tax=Streptacidiphilus carbonis TaxID=105422 RepID=UPI0005A61981|nr:LacI family DNA-binding transcriptional regulator [Streptacidiphilus carbonis]